MINGNACFAYFNKIWGNPRGVRYIRLHQTVSLSDDAIFVGSLTFRAGNVFDDVRRQAIIENIKNRPNFGAIGRHRPLLWRLTRNLNSGLRAAQWPFLQFHQAVLRGEGELT